MQDAADVECAESTDDLNEDVPDLLLLDVGLPLLIVTDFLEDIAVVGVLHHKTQARGCLVNECISIRDDIWMVNRGQDSHFI